MGGIQTASGITVFADLMTDGQFNIRITVVTLDMIEIHVLFIADNSMSQFFYATVHFYFLKGEQDLCILGAPGK